MWQITYHDTRPETPVVGDMWPQTEWWPKLRSEGYTETSVVGHYYFRDWLQWRPPLMIVLPGMSWFCIDSKATQGHNNGWTVQHGTLGTRPDVSKHDFGYDWANITVAPSINIGGTWHGHIQAGKITDDVEGRKYDSEGNLITR